MKGYFDNDEKVASLLYVAGLWVGTPWFANSDMRGAGVSCHNLPRQILIECKALRKDFPKVVGDPTQTRHSKIGVMEKFMDARPEFARVDLAAEPPAPGDVLGVQIYHCIDHLGVALPDNNFIHVLMHKNTDIDCLTTPPWQQHLRAAWRPL